MDEPARAEWTGQTDRQRLYHLTETTRRSSRGEMECLVGHTGRMSQLYWASLSANFDRLIVWTGKRERETPDKNEADKVSAEERLT